MPITKRVLKGVLVVLLVTRWAVAAELPTAKPAEVGLDPDMVRKAQDAVRALVEKKEMAGAVVAVACKGKVVLFEAFGESEAGSGKAMREDAIVRIYSMTKPITTVAAMILVEEGKLGLDDPVSKYLPELKGLRVHAGMGDGTAEAGREVTVRDLARHTSGLTYGVFGNSPVDQLYKKAGVLARGDSLQDTVAKLGKLPLMYQPGTRWQYGVSTDVLGRVVEVASGRGLDAFFAERIFKPLDMKDSGFFVPKDKLGRLAANHGYDAKGKKLAVTEAAEKSRYAGPPKMLSGGGGCVSTARDYLRFCQMLLNGGELGGVRLLKAATVAEMTRNQLSGEAMKAKNNGNAEVGEGFGLGFGVRVGKDAPASGRAVGEYYWGGAASTHFWISPRQELAVVALEQFMPNRGLLQQAVKPMIYLAAKK
ncbi:MAG: serine hydrolase domain-containing protein [Gemmataceae bacterium]